MDKKIEARLRRRKPCVGLCYIKKKKRQQEIIRKKMEKIEKDKKMEEV